MLTIMFPGQGSQNKGFGAQLFGEVPELTRIADQVLGYSVAELCTSDPRAELDQTQFTQPAVYVVNALAYEARNKRGAPKPDALIGHSLGEYNALLAAGVFDFETGLRLVQRRGALMAEAKNGAMAAVMNATTDEIERVLREAGLGAVDLANFNAPRQTVISGLRDDVVRAQQSLEAAGKSVVMLKTSGAFHSRYMEEAARRFGEYLIQFAFRAPHIPVIANCSAQPYQQDIAANLQRQIHSPVRWVETISSLVQRGDMQFEEVGESSILTGLVRRIERHLDQSPNSTPDRTTRPRDAKRDGPHSDESHSNQPRSDRPRSDQPRSDRPHSDEDRDSLRELSAQEKVARWNRDFPVGTRVASPLIADEALVTKSSALVLFGHRAAVYVDGYNGYFDLDELSVVR